MKQLTEFRRIKLLFFKLFFLLPSLGASRWRCTPFLVLTPFLQRREKEKKKVRVITDDETAARCLFNLTTRGACEVTTAADEALIWRAFHKINHRQLPTTPLPY